MLRLKTRPQFQAAMNGGTVARTPHFALHRLLFAQDGGTVVKTKGGTFDAEHGRDHSGIASPITSGLASEENAAPAVHPLFDTHAVWLGAMVPKRWARRAVTRNTIKRQIYAVSAGLEGNLCVAAHVVRLRSAFDRKRYLSATSDQLKQDVRCELLQLFAAAHSNATASPHKKVHH